MDGFPAKMSHVSLWFGLPLPLGGDAGTVKPLGVLKVGQGNGVSEGCMMTDYVQEDNLSS